MPNKLSQFWQELKRRNVVRVLTVYAGAAFVIIELINNITEPLHLPEWTPTLIIVLLAIGFPVVIIFSWIYDVHPEGGMVKTEPAHKVKSTEVSKSSNGWKIASYISFVVIIILLVLNIYGIRNRYKIDESLEKSVAVLPFLNLSGDPDQDFICDGLADEIISQLYKIESFARVPSLSSVLRYKHTEKSTDEIADELGVNYILEGSYKKLDDLFRFTVLLKEAHSDKQIWNHDYDKQTTESYSIPSDVALQIANHLLTYLTDYEKQSIKKEPTLNQEAFDKYLLGKHYFRDGFNRSSLYVASNLFKEAIALDPEFAVAYTHLAMCYLTIYWMYYDRNQSLLAESKKAIDAAIRINPELPEAYIALADYYYHGFMDYTNALDQLKKATELIPQDPECSYVTAAVLRRMGEWESAIEAFEIAHETDDGSISYIQDLAATYYMTGQYQLALDLLNKEMLRSPDIDAYYAQLIYLNLMRDGNTIKAREVLQGVAILNITETDMLDQSWYWCFPLDFYEEQYLNVMEFLSTSDWEGFNTRNWIHPKNLFQAITLELMGSTEKARVYYDSTRIQLERMLNEFPDDPRILGALGITYAGLGEKEKAIEAAIEGITKYSLEMDAFTGLFRVEELALTYIMLEEYDAALEQIEILLSNPGPFSAPLMKLDPRYRPLWDHPEFIRLTNTYAVK